MTNSHNRTMQKEGRNSDRQNASPNQTKSSNYYNNSSSNQQRKLITCNNNHHLQKSPSSASYFSNNNNNSNNPIMTNNKNTTASTTCSLSKTRYGRQTPPSMSQSIPINNAIVNRSNNNSSPGVTVSPSRSPSYFASPAGVSNSPPNLHFAGSKYFDAPSPNSLPRPPQHWTSPSDLLLCNGKNVNITTLPTMITSKRRLFNNTDNLALKNAHYGHYGHGNGSSDIISHNLKLLLNVQA